MNDKQQTELENKLITWGDILRAEKLLRQNRVPGPFYLEVKNPYWLQKFRNYQRYQRRYARGGKKLGQYNQKG